MPEVEKQSKLEIHWVKTNEVIPNDKNRNVHSEEQINRLCEIITYQGFRNPLIISNRTKKMVAGHGRLLAAKQLKLPFVPVMLQDFIDEDQEYSAGISDNSIAAWSELDLAGINTDVASLSPDFDIDLLGIANFEVEPADRMHGNNEDESKEDEKTCPNCGVKL